MSKEFNKVKNLLDKNVFGDSNTGIMIENIDNLKTKKKVESLIQNENLLIIDKPMKSSKTHLKNKNLSRNDDLTNIIEISGSFSQSNSLEDQNKRKNKTLESIKEIEIENIDNVVSNDTNKLNSVKESKEIKFLDSVKNEIANNKNELAKTIKPNNNTLNKSIKTNNNTLNKSLKPSNNTLNKSDKYLTFG